MRSRTAPVMWTLLTTGSALVIGVLALLLVSRQYQVREIAIRGDIKAGLRQARIFLVERFQEQRKQALAEAVKRLGPSGSTKDPLPLIKALSLNYPVIHTPFLIRAGKTRSFVFPYSRSGPLPPLRIQDRSLADPIVGRLVRDGNRLERAKKYVPAIRRFQEALRKNKRPDITSHLLTAVARVYRKMRLNPQADIYFSKAMRELSMGGAGHPDLFLFILQQRASISSEAGKMERAVGLFVKLYEKALAWEPKRGGQRYAAFRNEASDFIGRFREYRSDPQSEGRERVFLDLSLQWRYYDLHDREALGVSKPPAEERPEDTSRIRNLYVYDSQKTLLYAKLKKAEFWSRVMQTPEDPFFTRVNANGRDIWISLIGTPKGMFFGFSTPRIRFSRPTLEKAGETLSREFGLRLRYETLPEEAAVPLVDEEVVESVSIPQLPGVPRLSLVSFKPRFLARRVRREMLWSYALIGLLMLMMIGAGLLLAQYIRRERQLVKAKHDFLNLAAHTLRTPVTRLSLLAENLRSGWVRDAQERRAFLDSIDLEAGHMKDLVGHLLDFARIDDGKKMYVKRLIPLAPIVETLAARFSPELEREGFILDIQVDRDIPHLWLDARALDMVVTGLVRNAVKYSAKEKWIGIRVFRGDGEAVIQVEDRGMGIHDDDLPKVFDKFYRSSAGHVSYVEGSGLGLYMARHAVAAHGGSIVLESMPDVGTVVTVKLPIPGTSRENSLKHRRWRWRRS